MVEKCPGFQSNLCKFLMDIIRIVIIVIEESINNRQGSGSKAAVSLSKMLINLDKGVIRVLLVRRMEMLYKSKNRSRDCDYMQNLVSVDKTPYILLNRHTFIIRNDPCVIRVSACQILQISRDKDMVPCAIVLTTKREVCVCIFFVMSCCNMLRWWWCHVFKFYNSLVYYWLERIE